jgi:hypothetical protein
MLFVLGLFLIAIGVAVEMPTETYTHSWGTHTIHPYEGAAAFLIIVGIIVLVVAFIKARSKKTVSMRDIDKLAYRQTRQA